MDVEKFIKDFGDYIDVAIESLKEAEERHHKLREYEFAIRMSQRWMQMKKVKENFISEVRKAKMN